DTRPVASATTPGLVLHAIQTRNGSGTKGSGYATSVNIGRPKTTNFVSETSSVSEHAISSFLRRRLPAGRNWRQFSSTGANTSTPITSPSHQVRQDSKY